MLKGSIVAIVTPMKPSDLSISYEELGDLIDWHVKEGTRGIVVVGTTGESLTVSFNEHCAQLNLQWTESRVPVIAGTGANSTQEAIDLSRYAKEVGADFGLSVCPYYNKPAQDGLYKHFKVITETVDLPQILYNVPGVLADISNDTVVKLSEITNIIG